MEKYVVSRELAEKLKDAGYPQDTQYRYYIGDGYMGELLDEHYWSEHFADENIREGRIIAAPLSDELLEELKHKPIIHLVERIGGKWAAQVYFGKQIEMSINKIEYSTNPLNKPADALAELWLWCRENGYLEEKYL